MDSPNSQVDASTRGAADPESAAWIDALGATGPERERSLADLHAVLLRIARSEVNRRSVRTQIAGPELDDIAHQAAADALLAVVRKVGGFRGDARFTTWAYRFVVLEVSSKLGRHFWRHPSVPLDDDAWDRLPAAFGLEPGQVSERHDLLMAVQRAVEHDLTPKQRRVFVALVLDAVPVDALALELASTRGAIYKIMFDARRKLGAVLDANGYVDPDVGRTVQRVRGGMTGWAELDGFLRTDPADVGCDEALRLLHVYAELVVADPAAAASRYAGIAAHVRACGPCAEDLAGLLDAIQPTQSPPAV